MTVSNLKKPLILLAALAAGWLALKYLLPVLMPFLLGGALALAAEPLVGFSQVRLRMPRGAAAGVGVTVTLVMLLCLISLAGALVVRELGQLADAVPDLEGTARQGMQLLRDWLVGITERSPEGIRPLLTRTVLNFFDDGTALMEQVSGRLPGVISSLLGWVPDGALGLGTGILAGFMISVRLPRIRAFWQEKLFPQWREKYLPTIRRIRRSLGGWLRAQLKLTAVSYGIVALGFLILGIRRGPLWALLVALVDAVPLLGTGTVLLPWALVAFLQQQHFRSIGLICIYGAAMLTRTVLEPRFLGRQLGLDPLWTLGALYLGYRFWGILGMLFAPVLVTAVKSAAVSDAIN